MKSARIVHENDRFKIELMKKYGASDGRDYIYVAASIFDKASNSWDTIYSEIVYKEGIIYKTFFNKKYGESTWKKRVDEQVEKAKEKIDDFLKKHHIIEDMIKDW